MPTPAVAEGTRVSYLYGVVSTYQRPKLEGVVGVGGGRISFVEEGMLTAIVGAAAAADLSPPEEAEQEAAWLESAVRAHEYVLERCLEPGPVVPMRFATTLREEKDVRALLRERKTEFVNSLDRLAGTREWGVKGSLRNPTALARHIREARGDLAAKERELDGRSSGASYFGRKRLEQELTLAGDELVAESVRVAHEILAAVAVGACLTATRQPRSERIWLNGAYLVSETEEEAFRTQVAELDRAHAEVGVRYELTGPWPAYNFVGDEAER